MKTSFEDVLQQEEEYLSKCVEGTVLAFFNQGEVCTCPFRVLIQESIYDELISKVVERAQQIKRGNPLDKDTQVGTQASLEQFDKIMSYLETGRRKGAQFLIGGGKENVGREFEKGFYIQPTLMKGTNDMKVFKEEDFGPVVGVTTFKDEALAIPMKRSSALVQVSGPGI